MSAQTSYYNTVPETRKNVKVYTSKANAQDRQVIRFFMARQSGEYTPVEVHKYLIAIKAIDPRVPVTSIRRSMTSLSMTEDKHGNELRPFLVKTDTRKPGGLGRDCRCWKWNSVTTQGKLFE